MDDKAIECKNDGEKFLHQYALNDGEKFLHLYALNVSDKIEKKGSLNYLSWCYAWAEFKKVYPNAKYEVKKFDNVPYVHDPDTGYIVYTSVTAGDNTYEMWLPVMDAKNKALKTADMFDINKAIMRCLTKNLAMFGLGLYIYAGEDLPEGEDNPSPPAKKPVRSEANAYSKANNAEEWRVTPEKLKTMYGLDKPLETIKAIEDRFGVPLAEWDKATTEAAHIIMRKAYERKNGVPFPEAK